MALGFPVQAFDRLSVDLHTTQSRHFQEHGTPSNLVLIYKIGYLNT
jgi:hypothetical protein